MRILEIIICGGILVIAIVGLISELFRIADRWDIYKKSKKE